MITSSNLPNPPVEPTEQDAAEKDAQRRISYSFHAGHAAGFEDAAKMAREEAAKLFIGMKDGGANLMREFAAKLDDKAQASRHTQQQYKKP